MGVAIGGVLGGLSSVAAGRPLLEGLEDGALSGALLGAFFGGLGGLGWVLGSSGKVVGALGPVARAIPAVFGTSTVVALGMFGFDLLALGTSLFSMDHPLVQWNKRLHENGLYNAFQFTVSALAAFSGGFRKGMAGWQPAEGGNNAMPNAERAIINPKKLTDYALNPDHSVGANKARVFESALGYNQSNVDDLMRQIYEALPSREAVLGKLDAYGQRYTVDIPIMGPNGNTVNVRTGWIIKTGSDMPELITIFVKD